MCEGKIELGVLDILDLSIQSVLPFKLAVKLSKHAQRQLTVWHEPS
jgi:hypothetical protein